MAYHVYDTAALVLAERDSGEANKVFTLLTPELGLVRAQAQGIRWLKSKLRPQLSRYAYSRVALVRGKEIWRLTGAERLADLDAVYQEKGKLELTARVFSLLASFLHDERNEAALFYDLLAGLRSLAALSSDDHQDWEVCMVLRLLHRLGYVAADAELGPILDFSVWTAEIFPLIRLRRTKIVAVINKATAASQF
jgi:DNA repair protein RecO (recombination protein O)